MATLDSYLAIAGVVAVLGAGGAGLAVDTAASQAQTTTDDPALQSCISTNLAQPQLKGTLLKRKVKVGRAPVAYYQYASVESWVEANPCPDETSRKYELAVYFQSRNPRHRDRYLKTFPYGGTPSYSYDGADVFNQEERVRTYPDPGPKYRRMIYRCYPGKGIEHVQGRFRKTVYDANTGQQLAREVTKFPIKVGRPC